EMSQIHVTKEAIQAVEELRRDNPAYRDLSLRLYLEGKGCDGFFYGVTFDHATEEDVRFPQREFDLVCDPQTLPFVEDSTITWVDDDRGRGFLIENPRHDQYKGKFFRRKTWVEKLTKQ